MRLPRRTTICQISTTAEPRLPKQIVRTNKSARLHVRVIAYRTSSVAPNVLRYIDVVTTTSTCFASICVYRNRAKEPDRTKTVHHLEEEHSQLKMSDDKKREAKRVAAENGV
jgi:hypothetical protein